jgi:DNA-binding beta-propeller fold protein YncE
MHRNRLSLLLPLLLAADIAAQCVTGTTAATQPLAVTQIRAYRPFLAAPSRLAIDAAGSVYIADPGAKRIVVRDAAGRVTRTLAGLDRPASIAVGPTGALYAGEARLGRVDVYAADGHRTGALGRGDGEFSLPADIDVSAVTGEIYVADSAAHVVKRFAPNGALLQTIGGKGSAPGAFNVPTALFVDAAAGELYVVDQRNSRIQILGLDGAFHACIESRTLQTCPGGFSLMPCGSRRQFDQGIWVDAAKRIYIADGFDGRVVVIDRNGNLLGTIGSFGSGPGELDLPSDVVVDPLQRVFIAVTNSSRVDIVGLDGYLDPEAWTPGKMTVVDDPLDRATSTAITALVELPGQPLGGISAASITGNGIAAVSVAVAGDSDGNGIDELRVTFGLDLIRTLPGRGSATLVVRGTAGTLRFEESDAFAIVENGDTLEQRCPCSGPWKNHGEYVTCAVGYAQALVAQGRATAAEAAEIKRAAAESSCGKE